MTGDDFDRQFGTSRAFTSSDTTRIEGRAGRTSALGIALWGRNQQDLERQLAARHPELPPGYELADYWSLLRTAETLAAAASKQTDPSLSAAFGSHGKFDVGTERFTPWEARCEIVRRAIWYLDDGSRL